MTAIPARNRDRDLPEIVLVSVAEIGSGALEAHLLELARRLSPHATVHWGALASPRLFATAAGREIRRSFERSASEALSGRLVIVPHGPRFTGIGAAGMLLGWRLRSLGAGAGAVLHARGYLAALAAIGARKALPGSRVLHDVRGDRPAEVRIHGGEHAPERVAELEGVACRLSDAHLAVSGVLAEVLARRHGVSATVFASAADTEHFRPDPEGRARIRAELGLRDELLLGFVGSCAPWQKPEGVLALFARLREERPGARLLILSPDEAAWRRRLERAAWVADSASAPRADAVVRLRRASHEDVPAWISACDATALLRDDDDVNRVASPIKFGESLACGVPVLLTRGIGDASALVLERGLGACFDDPLLAGAEDRARLRAFLLALDRDPAALGRACREAAVERWSWSSQLPERLEIYRRLAAGQPAWQPVAARSGGGAAAARRQESP